MKLKIVLLTLLLGYFSLASVSGQTAVANQNKESKNHNSSVVRNKGITTISRIDRDKVIIAGYNTHFGKDEVRGYGILWRISDKKVSAIALPFGRINQMQWLSHNIGIVQSSGSGIFKTIDGGKNWEKVSLSDEIHEFFFLDQTSMWYVDNNSKFNHIRNSEKNILASFERSYIKRFTFTDEKKGWILGVFGNHDLLRSRDGGKTWQGTSIDSEAEVTDFQFFDNKDGYVLGKFLYSTNNGGDSWDRNMIEVDDAWFNHLFFLDKENGWIMGNKLCSTTTAGKNWKCNEIPKLEKGEIIKDIVFSNLYDGWFITDTSVFRTNDGGSSWSKFDLEFIDRPAQLEKR